MNRVLRKELLREIRYSRSRFLSIFVMVALGVLFLVGLRSAAPDMRNTADQFFDDANFFDVEILSTLGLTEEDIAAFSEVEDVQDAEGGWSLDAMAVLEDNQKVVKVENISPGGFNEPTVVEGRLPEAADECAVDEKMLTVMDVSVGDTITLEPAEGYADALSNSTFTVTAIVNSHLYIALDRGTSTLGDGNVNGFILVPEECFTLDYYTVAYIHGAGAAAMDAYGDEYQTLLDNLTDRLEDVAGDRADLRYETLVSDAQAELDDAQAEVDDAQAEVDDGRVQLDDAQAEVDDARAELIDARAEADQEIADAEQELADARQELDDGWAALEDAKQEYADAVADGQAELADARQELDDGWAELSDARDTLNSSQTTLDSSRASAESQLAEAKAELDAGEETWAAGQAELSASEEQVETLRQQVESYAAALEAQQAAVEAAEAAGITIDPSTLQFSASTLAVLRAALSRAEDALEEGQAELDAGRAELDAGWEEYNTQYDAAMAQLDAAQAEIDSGWGEYYEGLAELEQGEAEYADGLQEFESQTSEAEQEIFDAEAELESGEQEYLDGLQELEDARADADSQIADAQKEIDDAQAEIDDKTAELEDAVAEIADAEAEIADAQKEIDDIQPADVYVLNRDSNYGFVSYDQNATRMENLAAMFPLIFFIVAALVCLTTMTRMVEEERTQIGSIKAMGYGTGAIAAKYLVYGVLAALLGSIVGIIVGTTLIPWVIFTSYAIMYTIPELDISVYWGISIAATVAGIACTVLATLWAMLATARLSPAELMRPKAPKAGKRILLERCGPLWRHFSFSVKVSARNLFRYKKRFWMTVIGVAGCTALMISGLGLRTSIFTIIDTQFGDVYRYSVQVALEESDEETVSRIRQILLDEDNVESFAPANVRTVTFQANGSGNVDGYLTVTDDPEALYTQIDLRTMGGEHLDIPEDSVIIDEKLSELLNVGIGDEIVIDCGSRITVTVGAINEHYAYHYAYMTSGLYEQLMGEDYEVGEYFVSLSDTSDEALSEFCEMIMTQEGVGSASNLVAVAESFRDSMQAVNAAVMIIILSAAALALVVLYNLTNINITERIRELATIKVLGFFDMEVAMYIYRENIVLTILGILLGQIGGKFLCTYLVRTIEMDICMFGRRAYPQNYLMSILLSIIFAVLVNVLMYFRMKKIDMVQSLKSVE